MIFRLCFALSLAWAASAFAQDQPPANLATTGRGAQGGVARLVLSHQLYALGQATKDPLTVLNAARLAATVTLSDTPRARERTGDAAPISAPNPPAAAQMFAAAITLATENEALLDVIDAAQRDVSFAPAVVAVSTASSLSAGQTESWPLAFFGGSLAEVAILGNNSGNLDFQITDANGALICRDIGPSDTAYCSFYPAENGGFLMTVTNTGDAANSYLLLTN